MDEIKEKHSSNTSKKTRRFPIVFIVIYALFLLCLLIYIICLLNIPFADFINAHISAPVRAFLAHLTGWIPISLAEFLLLMLPILIVYFVVLGIKRYSDTWKDVLIFCGAVLSVLALSLSTFFVGFAPAYRGTPLNEKLEIERKKVSAEELYDTAIILTEKISSEAKNIIYGGNGFSVMPYNIEEMNERLLDAYDKICDKYTFVQRLDSRIKPVMLSEPMSYTHITGVYTFFTGEANINVNFPDYTLPYTAAHELAHQRGIAREDEANFLAFLVCAESYDPYIRYSGYLNLYEYVASALSSADRQLYLKAASTLPDLVLAEQYAYSDFFDKYRDSTASEISDTVNNTFLIIHGTEGVKSYGMVVDLAVAYYKAKGS